MNDRIEPVLDHVAIAVPDWQVAERRWRDDLGGGRSSVGENGVFGSRQLQFANAAKLELLWPTGTDQANFVRRFLERFGSTVHHVTFKVPDLHEAIGILARAGLESVDVNDEADYWKEAFLRPSQVGGIVVQIAQTTFDDDDWAAFTGFTREQPREGAASLLGPLLSHPDLDHAAAIWRVLGGTVERDDRTVRATWPGSPLDVVIKRDEVPGAVGLRMQGCPDLPAHRELGPAVLGR